MLKFLRSLRRPRVPAFTAPVEVPRPVYAVGDIHGRHDLLEALLARIAEDAATFDEVPRIVFMGDYVDRGDGARETLDLLMALAAEPGAEMVFLMGNHEQMLLRFLRKPSEAEGWLRYGGRETLLSYGVRAAANLRDEASALTAKAELIEAMGPHLGFIEGLRLSHRAGNVFFAHAGADPAVPVEDQQVQVLLWGSPAFAATPRSDGIWVVHGHTVVDQPRATEGRISVDTGAYFSGRLTAARIWRGEVTFLNT